uniref:Rho-GAP domain-containing protein n=1 Tax=Amphiprion ocellaris TaxID=80972 RepID=A0A3Q1AL08_AMPOC
MLGQSVRLQPVPIQSLSELERARLQEVALYHLEERDLDFKISIPREIRKRRKSLRRKFDSFSKEKKERESAPKAFGIPLSQVIANDRAYKRRQDALKESRRDCLELEASILRFRAEKRQFFNGSKPLGSSSSITGGGPGSPSANSVAPAPVFDAQNKPMSPTFLDNTGRGQRRGGLSVDSISDLVESQSRLLEALQLSHPAELELKKSPGGGSSEGRTQTKLSLNPIYRQVPRVLERCCSHIETYGLQTVGIFRVGSSKKRVRQLRDDFDMGVDVQLDEEHSVHDVAALLKEFLRDMPDPLLPRELYPAFLHANLLRGADQLQYLQHLLYLLPPCNCDTLLRLLTLLHTVQGFAQDSIGTNDEEVGRRSEAKTALISHRKHRQFLFSMESTEVKLIRVLQVLTSCKSIRHMRQFHSHHNLLSLAQPSSSSSSPSSSSRLQAPEQDQDRRGPLGSALSFSLGGTGGSCSSLSGSSDGSIWVRQTPQDDSKASPAANFWDFFTGKGSGSETMV